MLLLFIASLAFADLAPPPGIPLPPACDISRCPQGTTATKWCDSTLGKLAECKETEGWPEACRKKAGRYARHLMCKPQPTEPTPSVPEPTAPDVLVPPPVVPPVPTPVESTDPPAAAAPHTTVAPKPSARCQTAPAGHLIALLPLFLLMRRRPRSLGAR
jgi:hypothetical protein